MSWKTHLGLLAGLGLAALASACTVTVKPDGGGGAGGDAGSAGTGGSAGTAGAGGTLPFVCDDDVVGGRTSATCTPAPGGDAACSACIEAQCAPSCGLCKSYPPDPCLYGAPAGQGEFICFRACLLPLVQAAGALLPADIQTCAGDCATPACEYQGLTEVSAATSALVDCTTTKCPQDCYDEP